MARYIDAEALINELEAGGMPIYESGISKIHGDKDCIRDYIERAPSADVQEVKHGKWSDKMVGQQDKVFGDTHFGFQCSECGAILNKTPYCGNCGAKMDGIERDL